MNGSTIELPLLASDLGRQEGFSYTFNAFSIVPGGFVDTTGSALFNPFAPAVSSGDFATIAPGGRHRSPSPSTRTRQKTPALGWLVASVDDANGAAQAAEVAAPQNLK